MKRWVDVPLRFRTLLWGFMRNEIRGRFTDSVFGFAWSVVTPLATLLTYLYVFSVIFQVRVKPDETGTDNFVLFFLAGMLPWAAFSEAVGRSSEVFLGRANLISKVAFPLEVLPVADVCAVFSLHAIGYSLFMIYLAFEGYAGWNWILLPGAILIHMLFTLGIVILVGSWCVFLRDVRQILGLLLTLWFFMTPIIYPPSMVPEGLRWLTDVNPMLPFVDLYREILLREDLSWGLFGYCGGLSFLAFSAGALFFGRSRNAFADVL